MTPGGHGLAAFRGNTNAVVEFASWNGTWSMLASEGTSTSSVGAPYAGGTGAFLAYQNGSVGFAQYDEATMAWSPANQATGASSDNNSLPAVVAMSTGAPMALFTGVNGLAQQYGYSIQSGTTWSTAAAPGEPSLPSPGPETGSRASRSRSHEGRTAGPSSSSSIWTARAIRGRLSTSG